RLDVPLLECLSQRLKEHLELVGQVAGGHPRREHCVSVNRVDGCVVLRSAQVGGTDARHRWPPRLGPSNRSSETGCSHLSTAASSRSPGSRGPSLPSRSSSSGSSSPRSSQPSGSAPRTSRACTSS